MFYFNKEYNWLKKNFYKIIILNLKNIYFKYKSLKTKRNKIFKHNIYKLEIKLSQKNILKLIIII